jgi:DinB family protein
VTPKEVAEVLEGSGHGIESMLKGLTPDMASWHPAQGEWCVNEVVGHIIEAEKRGFAGRIRIILGADNPDLPTWDRASVGHARRDCEKQPSELAVEFSHVRRESLELIRSLQEDQLSRGGNHPEVGRLSVDEVLHEWIHHDGNHFRQAVANIQAYVWPSMGNAQKFSTG